MTLRQIEEFALERYFARWEFVVQHQLSASDVEPCALSELLALADGESRDLWARLVLGYSETAGHPKLRDEIARLYSELDASNILVVAGAEEGIYLMMHALLADGDDAVVVTPAYQSLHSLPRSLGARVVSVPLRPDNGWAFDIGDIERAVTARTRVIAVNFPHNPTGAHIDAETLRRLAAIAEQANAVLLSDEVYRGLEYRAGELLPPAADLSPAAISLGVMSKSFALPGLRIGWIATRNRDVLDRVARLKDYTTICSSAPSEILALIALRARDTVLSRSRGIVAANLRCAHDFFRTHAGEVEWVPPRAGSVAFPRLLRHTGEAISPLLAERESVLMIPGNLFGDFPHNFRLGLGRRDLPLALEKFSRLLTR